MIQAFVDRYMARKEQLREQFSKAIPSEYKDIVLAVARLLSEDESGTAYGEPDPDKIHVIDDGDYQGTQLFVIAEKCSQPSTYWAVMVNYGSCSGCDSLQSIQDDDPERWEDKREQPVPDSLVEQLMSMSLHIVQRMQVIEV